MIKRVLQILTHPSLELKHLSGEPHSKNTPLSISSDQMMAFLDQWNRWSKKIDLTSEDSALLVLEKHVFDSLQYAKAVDRQGKTMDIGSGAGFPGIPLKIVYPELDITLVESRRKRANYLMSVVRTLKLDKTQVINARAEELPEEHHQRYDQVIFKAVAPLHECMELAWPFLKDGGHLIVKKEPDASATHHPSKQYTLIRKIPITNLAGVLSELQVYMKCST